MRCEGRAQERVHSGLQRGRVGRVVPAPCQVDAVILPRQRRSSCRSDNPVRQAGGVGQDCPTYFLAGVIEGHLADERQESRLPAVQALAQRVEGAAGWQRSKRLLVAVQAQADLMEVGRLWDAMAVPPHTDDLRLRERLVRDGSQETACSALIRSSCRLCVERQGLFSGCRFSPRGYSWRSRHGLSLVGRAWSAVVLVAADRRQSMHRCADGHEQEVIPVCRARLDVVEERRASLDRLGGEARARGDARVILTGQEPPLDLLAQPPFRAKPELDRGVQGGVKRTSACVWRCCQAVGPAQVPYGPAHRRVDPRAAPPPPRACQRLGQPPAPSQWPIRAEGMALQPYRLRVGDRGCPRQHGPVRVQLGMSGMRGGHGRLLSLVVAPIGLRSSPARQR